MDAKQQVKEHAEELPDLIGLRMTGYEAEMRRWRKTNKRVPWSQFLRDALDAHFNRTGRKAA